MSAAPLPCVDVLMPSPAARAPVGPVWPVGVLLAASLLHFRAEPLGALLAQQPGLLPGFLLMPRWGSELRGTTGFPSAPRTAPTHQQQNVAVS